jgi:hypothetical protein
MDLPKEFFTPESAATLTGAVAITYVVSNTVQSIFNFNPRWLAGLIALAVSMFGVWYTKGDALGYVFGALNGCLIYLSAVGLSAVTRTPGQPPQRRSFLSSWW